MQKFRIRSELGSRNLLGPEHRLMRAFAILIPASGQVKENCRSAIGILFRGFYAIAAARYNSAARRVVFLVPSVGRHVPRRNR
jgi:hypothetical protein